MRISIGQGSLRTALRAAVWKATPEARPVGFAVLVAWAIGAIALSLVTQYIGADAPCRFSYYGLNAVVAHTAVLLTLAALVAPREGRMTVLSVMLALSIIHDLVWLAFTLALPQGSWRGVDVLWTGRDTQFVLFLVYLVWWLGAMFAAVRSVDHSPYTRRFARAACLYAATLAAYLIVPHYPAFRGSDFDQRSANSWEYVASIFRGDTQNDEPIREVDSAKVELAQPALMEAAVARLAPQTRGRTDFYAIGIAGDALQDVFIKELDGALASLGQVLPIQDKIIRLVNHVDSVEETSIASRGNFAAAVHAIGRVMDKDEDVLIVFVTSHGSSSGAALVLPSLIDTDLSPEDVASVLDREGIPNRVVIVSACFAGVFVKPLANENTVVVTAADDKHTSFGCSNEREWTYFGDAFFNQSLRPGVDLEQAFHDARILIGQWETRDGLPYSNPQGHFGRVLMEKLRRAGVERQADAAKP